MILATHAIIGAAIGSTMPQAPLLAFTGGFVSHFILDALPHWDYELGSGKSIKGNKLEGDFVMGKAFIVDVIKVIVDACIGILAVIVFFDTGTSLASTLQTGIFWGAVGAMFPDGLQFFYYKLKIEPLRSLQKFHLFIQAKRNLNDYSIIGPMVQIVFCAMVIVFSRILL
jgi:hypothetical protein